MKLPRAILFDLDGVLIASEQVHWMAWGKLLEEMHLPYDEAEIRAMVGMTAPRIMKALLDKHRPGWTSAEYDVDALALHKNDHYLELIKTHLKAYPGTEDGLKWLKMQGIKSAVVSNAKRREMMAALQVVGLDGAFDVLISRDDVTRPKPDPAPYLLGAKLTGFDPRDCLAVEDSPTGIESALFANVPAAAVLTNFSRTAMTEPVPARPDLKPIWIGESLLELFKHLKSLASPKA